MNNLKSIHIIITGGTIDSHWDHIKDTAVPNVQTVLPEYLESVQIDTPIKFDQICMKDSREIDQTDRENIIKAIKDSNSHHFIITHGTYTMKDTARYIAENLEVKDKVIILTGSMVPLKGYTHSDGIFNLGFAVAQLEYLAPGVYLAMHGKVFNADNVEKNLSRGKFMVVN